MGGEEETTRRIFVGGLGLSVMEDDVRKTFSSLGKVESVEIVRTKGRSFAYFDFLPSSDKALAKLFSTYNACMWKGGRLRLEKAKEHYLTRLRHEWAEDAELASNASSCNVDAAENLSSSVKLKKVPNSEKMQLRIYFPKLKQVKSVPFRGTGKHKYSFQRIEVPPLPTHFCDCEEHSHTKISKEELFCHGETESGGINEEELNMMKSVMNKLFEKESCSKALTSKAGSAKEREISVNSIDDSLVNEDEADNVSDEDGLVLNMVSGANNRIAMIGNQGHTTITANEESILNKPQASKDRSAWKMHESQKRKIVPPNKKRKSYLAEVSEGTETVNAIPEKKGRVQTHLNESVAQQLTSNHSWSQKSAWRNLVGAKGNEPLDFSQSMPSVASTEEEQPSSDGLNVPYSADKKPSSDGLNVMDSADKQPSSDGLKVTYSADNRNQSLVKDGNSKNQSVQSEELVGAPPAKPNAVSNVMARGASWLQKSSWTQLVSDTNNSSFCISQILPSVTFGKQELQRLNNLDPANLMGNKQSNLFESDRSESIGDGSKSLGAANQDLLTTPHRSNLVASGKKEQCPAGMDTEQTIPEKGLQDVGVNNEVATPTLRKKDVSAPGRRIAGDLGIGETCSFMRSAASMREWMKTKTALSGSFKKKGNEKKAELS